MPYRNHCNSVSTRHYTGGAYRPIIDLINEGSHVVEVWGNSREGFKLYLVDGADVGCPISSGPFTLRRDAIAAAKRAIGADIHIAHGRGW